MGTVNIMPARHQHFRFKHVSLSGSAVTVNDTEPLVWPETLGLVSTLVLLIQACFNEKVKPLCLIIGKADMIKLFRGVFS